MTAVRILATLRARGARIQVRGGMLHVEAPKGKLDAGLKEALVAQKTELVDLLTVAPNALIAETFARITAFWVEGAELPPNELEAEIDQATLAGDLTALTAALSVYEQAARESCARIRPDLSQPAAVRLTGTAIGDIWLVADLDVLTEQPDIAASGLPVLTFADVPHLAGLTPEALRAVAALTKVLPGSQLNPTAAPMPDLPPDTIGAVGLAGDKFERGDGRGRWIRVIRPKGTDR